MISRPTGPHPIKEICWSPECRPQVRSVQENHKRTYLVDTLPFTRSHSARLLLQVIISVSETLNRMLTVLGAKNKFPALCGKLAHPAVSSNTSRYLKLIAMSQVLLEDRSSLPPIDTTRGLRTLPQIYRRPLKTFTGITPL